MTVNPKSDLDQQVAERADLVWRKSSHSNPDNCVEVARLVGGYAIRDSKNPARTPHTFDDGEWTAFCRSVAGGEFG